MNLKEHEKTLECTTEGQDSGQVFLGSHFASASALLAVHSINYLFAVSLSRPDIVRITRTVYLHKCL